MAAGDARELLQAGRLAEAIAAQQEVVKAQPLDAGHRYLLFGLLCCAGEWERAARQLDALGHQDPQLAAAAVVYRNLLASERQREAVFAGQAQPLLPDDPPRSATERLAALAAWRLGELDATGAHLEAAIAAEVKLSGRLGDREFVALRDLDDLLGSVLEVFAGGRYLWLPFERIRRLDLGPPGHFLDLLWLPARLRDASGMDAAVHLPVLYAGSASAVDEPTRLGRGTEWRDEGAFFRGLGQRVLALAGGDGEEHETGILAVRSLEFGPARPGSV